MRREVVAVVLVGAGGFVGAVLRYLLAVGLGGPAGTLAANVLGSFALGVAVTFVDDRRVRLFLATGLLSSFTTYSTFAVETTQLGLGLGTANVLVTYGAGLLAAFLGLRVGGLR
jgi:CrcB protein